MSVDSDHDRWKLAVDHEFDDPTLLQAALTHRSWRNEHADEPADNQRLEFLGDAVIDLIVARHLYDELSGCREGVLTVLKSSVVDETALAGVARSIGLGDALRVGRGERLRGGRELPSVLADALEALFGALLIDAGYKRTRDIALRLFSEPLARAVQRGRGGDGVHVGVSNWKTAIQERLQAAGERPPKYKVIREDGPAHGRTFSVCAEATWQDREVSAEGSGRTKKAAEHQAAGRLMQVIEASSPEQEAEPAQ